LDLKPHFPDNCLVNYIYDPAEWIIILHLPDLVRFVFRLPDDEGIDEALQETAVQQRITRFLKAKAQVNIRTRAAYRVHQRVADTFRVGRVMLLGDAAHLNNPFGGMGMNSGIHDAHFLAPRLTAVLQGSSEHLLDEYSRVRREVALNIVNEYSDKKYRDLSAADEAVRRQRNEKMRQMAANPARARAYLLRASMLDDRI